MPVRQVLFIVLLTLLILSGGAESVHGEDRIVPDTCTYEISRWNVRLKHSVARESISHPYNETTRDEIDPVTGCTICREDQVLITIPPLEPFFICYKVADVLRGTLESLLRNNEPIFSIRGYKVIKSRGEVDHHGNRTVLSNHSFGSAIDINRELNGLYDNCYAFGPQCHLVLGGERRIGVPGTLERDDKIVSAMKSIGFSWGGEIQGKQKDFMHFSFSGY